MSTLVKPSGSSQAALIDRDISHITRVMRSSLQGDLAGPILSPAYWRKRLHALLDSGNLSHAQLCSVDSLLLQLDHFDAESHPAASGMTPTSAALYAMPRAARAAQPVA